MNGSLLALGELVALAYVSFALVISAMSAGLYPLVRDRLRRWSPGDRASWIFAFCMAPALGALLLTVACLLPSIEGLSWHLIDHCSAHGNEHPHLCLAHLPAGAGNLVGLLALGSLAMLFIAALVDLVRSTEFSRQLRAAIENGQRGGELDGSQPLAATIGILRPKVIISTALRRNVPRELVAAIAHHEDAHVRRRDPLLRTVARFGTVLHLPAIRRDLLRDLHLACEQACDERAAVLVGDRLLVARALLAVERLLSTSQERLPAAAAGFADAGIAARVNALLEDPVSRAWNWLPGTLAALLILVVATADRIHHTTETLLGLVAG